MERRVLLARLRRPVAGHPAAAAVLPGHLLARQRGRGIRQPPVLLVRGHRRRERGRGLCRRRARAAALWLALDRLRPNHPSRQRRYPLWRRAAGCRLRFDRTSIVSGTSVAALVVTGGGRIIK